MGSFAEGTTVTPERSQAEIVATLKRYGAEGFMYGEDNGAGMVAFRAHGRQVRFIVPLDIDRAQFTQTDAGRTRTRESVDNLVAAEHRRRWRSLALAIKAKLEVVDTGISTFEQEFLAHIVLPNGSTVGDFVAPQLEAAYAAGEMPKMLPSGS